MQRRKNLVAILAILLVGIVSPVMIQKGHADDATSSLTVSGFLARNQQDNYFGCCYDLVQAGNSLTFQVLFTANSNQYQRNLTMGVKFDWMTNYQNTTSVVTATAGQTVIVSLTYTIPALTGQYANLNLGRHIWTVQLWDMRMGKTWTSASCTDPLQSNPPWQPSCNTYYYWQNGYNQVLVYNTAQTTCYTDGLQAGAIIGALNSVLGSQKSPAPGTSSALALLAQATTQYDLAQEAYSSGDFDTAATDYANSLNDANAAQSSLQTVGGGTDTATMTSIWVDSVAVLLGGLGAILVAILVGFSAFKFLRGRTKMLGGYTSPSAPKA